MTEYNLLRDPSEALPDEHGQATMLELEVAERRNRLAPLSTLRAKENQE